MMKQVFKRTEGLKDKEFHYCGGCLHSVVHRLIGEVLEEMGLLDCTIGICPVGCAVFMYDYLKINNEKKKNIVINNDYINYIQDIKNKFTKTEKKQERYFGRYKYGYDRSLSRTNSRCGNSRQEM